MRKILIITIISIAAIIALSVHFFSKVRKDQVAYQKEILFLQIQKCGSQVEKTLSDYENDLNRIIFKHINKIYTIFEDRQAMFFIGRDLEGLYAKYRDLVTSISVYDDKDKFLGIYINENDDFVVDTFARQTRNVLEPKDVIKVNSSRYVSYFPYFRDGELEGNIVVEIDLDKYIRNVFELFRIQEIQYQWLVNGEGEMLISNFNTEVEIPDAKQIADSVLLENIGSIEHRIKLENHSYLVLSYYYPLNIINNDLGIVFTMNTRHLINKFVKEYRVFTIFILIIFLGLFAYLFYVINTLLKKQKKTNSQLLEMKMIFEHFPVGIMVLNKNGVIRMINQTGQDMLFSDTKKDLIGEKFEDHFLISNHYLLEDNHGGAYDSNHFLHFTKEGNEYVIYRKEEEKQIQGEKYLISAFIDVSPLDKSRKQEAAANQAKSDFLARMSHEIRTPMNGIIGMTENLLHEKIDKSVREQVEVIQKSAELLLTIINDILDFSKIEAGKMMLEEIPFSLSEELEITFSLFKPLIDEKDLDLSFEVKGDVPDKLIGDPFRLRQVISNLLSNSVKFTSEGKIALTVSLMERYNNGLSLLFDVEDTGIGIAKDKIEKIFSSYEQAGGSTSRKFGGTGLGMAISKQLVDLMNGEIWIESPSSISDKENHPGTRVSFTIEVHSDEKIEKDYDYSQTTKFSQITALILSKKKDETDNVHRVLDSFGINYKYREYDDQAIDSVIYHIEQNTSLYQLIFLKDKPGYDAFGLALQLKENNISNRFPLVMISSNDKPGNYRKCKSLWIDHYLIQPYDNHEVFKILQQTFLNLEDKNGVLDQINKIRSNLNILIAEDNIINQRVVQSLFKHLGHEVEIAGNGEEAVKMVNENKFDVVFMDIFMPVMDGFTATREIRSSANNVTIIAMTGSEEAEKKDEAFQSGMNDYITKPVKVEAIKHLLIKWFSEALEV